LLEPFWPYIDGTKKFDKTSPPSKFDPEAAKYPVIEYQRVTGGSAGICQALADGYVVSIGTPWYSKWMSPKNGVLPVVKAGDSVAGGHETLLYGYKDSRFMGMNSWGTGWGNKGMYTMPFSAFDGVFQSEGGFDAHIIKISWGTQPEPEPTNNIKVKVSTDGGTNWSDFAAV
jgi:hypothetical protein